MKKIILVFIAGLFISSCSSSKLNNKKFDKVENKKILDSLLTVNSKKKIETNHPIVVVFYPGKDKCNSSGSSTRESTKIWYDRLEKGIYKITKANIFYIYKDTIGLYGRNDGFKTWFKDPNHIIEKMFKESTKCSGYVLISPNSELLSHPSEFSQDGLWKNLKLIIK
ncbi:MAG: hypothetical protein ACI924_002010 [Flavobacterium sp.]|jgi:hypothetical protein